jgi:hypothetical protein
MQQIIVKILIALVLLLVPQVAVSAPTCVGTTCTAESAANTSGSYHVQAAVDACKSSGSCTTVVIPAGTVTWDTVVTVNPTDKGMAIRGQSRTSPSITATGNMHLFDIDLTTGNFELSKMKLVGTRNDSDGDIAIDGSWDQLRIHEIDWTSSSGRGVRIGMALDGRMWGGAKNITHQRALIDDINFTSTTNTQFLYIWGRNNYAWLEDDNFGTIEYVILENSTLVWGNTAYGTVLDTEYGARATIRYCNVTNGFTGGHDFSNGRGHRSLEIYNNTFAETTSQDMIALDFTRGGTGLAHHNTFSGYASMNNPMNYRTSYQLFGKYCSETGSDKICLDYAANMTHCVGGTKAGWQCWDSYGCPGGTCPDKSTYAGHLCSTNDDCKDGAGNATACVKWDGSGVGNYPCRDQTGRGKDNPTTGVQALSPLYWWNNTVDGVSNTAFYSAGKTHITENIDYYSDKTTGFNGTAGIGIGLKATMTAIETCTDNVGYWATDERKLYTCSSNVWVEKYRIYTCPHPWTGLSGSCSTAAGRDGYNVGYSKISIGSGSSMTIGSGATATLY